MQACFQRAIGITPIGQSATAQKPFARRVYEMGIQRKTGEEKVFRAVNAHPSIRNQRQFFGQVAQKPKQIFQAN
jgi:hypothetical protein